MRTNSSELGIDQSKIIVAGKSAGGHLALMAGLATDVAEFEGSAGITGVSSAVTATVGIAPVLDMFWSVGQSDLGPFLGKAPTPEVIKSASPLNT